MFCQNNMLVSSGVVCNDVIYTISAEFALLIAIDSNTKKVLWIKRIPNEDLFTKSGCIKMLIYKEWLVIVPFNFKNINMYNIEAGTWQTINYLGCKKNSNMYSDAFLSGNDIVFVGAIQKNMLLLDVQEKCTRVINTYFETLENSEEFYCCRGGVECVGEFAYIPVSCKSEIVKYNCSSHEHEIIQLGNSIPGFSGVAYAGERFWISPRGRSDVIVCDKDFKIIRSINVPSSEQNNYPFSDIFEYDGVVFLCGQGGEYSYILSEDDYSIRRLDKPFMVLIKEEDFLFGQLLDGGLYLRQRETEKCFPITVDRHIYGEFLTFVRDVSGEGEILWEKTECDISDFMNSILEEYIHI